MGAHFAHQLPRDYDGSSHKEMKEVDKMLEQIVWEDFKTVLKVLSIVAAVSLAVGIGIGVNL